MLKINFSAVFSRLFAAVAVFLAVYAVSLTAFANPEPGAYQAFLTTPNANTAFTYVHEVATHPRCANCHGVVVDGVLHPTVGEDRQLHPMGISIENNVVLIEQGGQFMEVPGTALTCSACHQKNNLDKPGAPPGNISSDKPGFLWHMPQPVMTIPKGITSRELCEKWLDPEHNSSHLALRGGRGDMQTFRKEFFEQHIVIDPLIAWSWEPGVGREKAPGKHQDFIRAVEIWVDAGAPCPE